MALHRLAEARQQAGLAGEKMKQEGGVRRGGQLAVDAKATPFGEYDAAWIRAVQEQWYNLLDNSSLSPKSGKGPAPPRIPARYKKNKRGESQ